MALVHIKMECVSVMESTLAHIANFAKIS
jgi:hypothetical protein